VSRTYPRQVDAKPTQAPQSFFSIPFLWPLVATATASEAAASILNDLARTLVTEQTELPLSEEPQWATRHRVALELQSMRLRDFSQHSHSEPTLICAPFALHGATVADFARGHSLVETLRGCGVRRVFVTDWRSATPEMRFLSVDSYLADLNVAVDELGSPVDLIGLCQGGWMALLYAARFPTKVRRLVLVGAPIDIHAGESALSRFATNLPLAAFEEIVRLGEGRVLGRQVLGLWAPTLAADGAARVLQIPSDMDEPRWSTLRRRFDDWYAWTVDLPGRYYLQVVSWLYKENRIAEGRFVALGHKINLAAVRVPVYLLAARDDELVSAGQLFATADRIGTPRKTIELAVEPCSHLSLFLGAQTLHDTWPKIARWLSR
jgi:poly(3-hydroxyalkanoate) synthetase